MTTETSTDTVITEKVDEIIDVQEPNMYKVILHNDDKTTVDFVISVLIMIFHKDMEEALAITQLVHEQGQGIAGAPYTKEIAEEKTKESILYARANNFPLTVTFEEL